MDVADASAPRVHPQAAPMRWNIHTMVVASGASAIEGTSQTDLLAALAADPQLSSPSHQRNSYRIIRRVEVEEAVRIMRVAAVKAEREAAKTAAATDQDESNERPLHPVDEPIDVGVVAITPITMALAFQWVVARDKQACAEHVDSTDEESSTPATRIFLLVDYPSTVAEAHALLLMGEADQIKVHPVAPSIPLLPLLDGVLLVVDPMRELRERRKSMSLNDERRKSLARRISTEGNAAVDLADKQLPIATFFQTANPLVRDLYEAAGAGGLEWSDLEFMDIACCVTVNDVKPVTDLVHDLEALVARHVTKKTMFKEWVSSVKTMELPVVDVTNETAQAVVAHYDQQLGDVFAPSVTVASIVWAMREAVACSLGEVDREDAGIHNNVPEPEAFIDYGDNAALSLALSYDMFVKGAHLLSHPCDPCYMGGERIDVMEKDFWRRSDLPGVGNHGRKAMPVHPRLSNAERSVLDTEFRSFATLPVPRAHLMRQLLRFEELLGQPWKGKLQLRDVVESFSLDVLPQRLASILREQPTIVKDYDEATDSLLVAAFNATAPGRFRTTSWTARDHVRHRPALRDWHVETLPTDDYLTPRSVLAATACVSLSAGQLSAVSEKCSIAYPADQSIIKLYQTPHAPAWVTVSLDGDVFGLRPTEEITKHFAMQFYASLVDQSQVLIREGRPRPKKPDGHSAISTTHTSADGLIVRASSDGTIVLQKHRIVNRETSPPVEIYRVISGKGAIVCVMSDASSRIMLPNGDVEFRSGVDSAEPPLDLLANAQHKLIVDPETNAVVETRTVTGVVIVTQTDGSRVTYHTDGTTVYSTPARSHVLITTPGLPDVCIDVDVNLAAQRHSNGEKVAVTKGGLRTRSVIRLTDGSEVQIQYNTKVVAEVNGHIVIEKPNGTKVVAKDSGRVEFTSRRTSAASPRTESDEDADRDELSHNRIYYFSCRDGNLSLVDHEQNQFRVDVGDGRGIPTVAVDLAGVLSESDADKYGVEPIPAKAVINDPIEPYLFVLHGDGTGQEMLRPRDVRDYLETGLLTSAVVSEATQLKPPPPFSTSGKDWWLKSSLWAVERTFVEQLRPDPRMAAVAERKWFGDGKLTACFERLKTPVATVFGLITEAVLPPPYFSDNQFIVVRHLEQLRPMTSDDVTEMLTTVDKWREWQAVREANKDQYKVMDPRDAEVLAQEAAMQRKVLAACKAMRARKKAERQKQREIQRKSRAENSGNVHMETVQEGNEPQDGDKEDDDIDQFFSDGSDDDSPDDIEMEVDDPDQLMWTAYSHTDVDDIGRLTLAQTRQALVQVLGLGISLNELRAQLETYKQAEPFGVSFELFVDLVHVFQGDNLHTPEGPEKSCSKPVGSATEAVRSMSLLRLYPS